MFENIVGNTKNKTILKKVIENKKAVQAYMFIGEEGIGKKMIAEEFSKMLLCTDEEQKYCNKCKSCIGVNTNNNPDFYIISPDGNSIKIDQIRQMQEEIYEKPIVSRKKVFIIDNADTMTKEAQNCLLKTLEEPPTYITIILICSNENNILVTVKSRCNKMYFDKIENTELKKFLNEKYPEINFSENMISSFNGSIGKALEINDKLDLYTNIDKLIFNIENKDIIQIMEEAQIIYKSKEDIIEILKYINVLLFNKIKENIKMANCIKIVENTKTRLNSNSNYDMTIDNMLIKIWEELR